MKLTCWVKPLGSGVHLSPRNDLDDTIPQRSTPGVAGFTRVSISGRMDPTRNPSASLFTPRDQSVKRPAGLQAGLG